MSFQVPTSTLINRAEIGISILKIVPRELDRQLMWPLWTSIIFFTIAKPRPVPPVVSPDETKGSNIDFKILGRTPGP